MRELTKLTRLHDGGECWVDLTTADSFNEVKEVDGKSLRIKVPRHTEIGWGNGKTVRCVIEHIDEVLKHKRNSAVSLL